MGCWCCACTCESCQKQRLFTGAKEAKFLDFSNGKPVSSWLISISSNISLYKFSFCTSNSWLLFCFDLSTAHLRCATPTSYVISSARSGCEHKLDKSDYYGLNMDIFLRKKNTSICYRRPLFTPQSHVRHFFIVDGCALLDLFWTDEEKHPPIAL